MSKNEVKNMVMSDEIESRVLEGFYEDFNCFSMVSYNRFKKLVIDLFKEQPEQMIKYARALISCQNGESVDVEYQSYLVSSFGVLKNAKNNREYHLGRVSTPGYSVTGVKSTQVHSLIARCFLPLMTLKKMNCHHINSDKQDNFASNLISVPREYNVSHASGKPVIKIYPDGDYDLFISKTRACTEAGFGKAKLDSLIESSGTDSNECTWTLYPKDIWIKEETAAIRVFQQIVIDYYIENFRESEEE